MPPFWRPSWWKDWFDGIGGNESLYPLIVLFGLNCVDELDRRGFDVLLPDIRDHFGISTGTMLTVVGLAGIGALLCAVPIGFYADRMNRIVIMIAGAIAWGGFSVMTGLATTIVLLGVARAGAGLGRAVVDPTHNSLLADYYDIPERPRVYSFHRAANALGTVPRAADRGHDRGRVGMARALLRLRDPDRGVRGPRAAAARARPRPLRTAGDGPRPARRPPPRTSRRAGPSPGAHSSRYAPCGGSTSRCRSSPWRSSDWPA